MKQVAIVSGKGGTGKTTVVASLGCLAAPLVMADCDVDAANLALLLPGEDEPWEAFFAGQRATVDPEKCEGCGVCEAECRFGAIGLGEIETATVDTVSCEGCGVCSTVCPTGAVSMHSNRAGALTSREIVLVDRSQAGILVHARLGIAQENSGKLVAEVRAQARKKAAEEGLDLVLIDGPPGIGCPVHAAVTGADLLVAVTEPTPSGVHDLERLLELAQAFGLQTAVIINKSSLSRKYVREVEYLAQRSDAPLLGRLPFDPAIPRLLAAGRTPLALPDWAGELGRSWQGIQQILYRDVQET